MLKKEIILITGNTSWWKRKKYRMESAMTLRQQKIEGWKLLKKFSSNKPNAVDSRTFHKYLLIKK